MSSLTTAFLGAAVIAGSAGITLAQDSTTKVKPCIGELCPPKSPKEDMPRQTMEGANHGEQMQGQDQSSSQVMPRKKKQASFHEQQPSKEAASSQVMPRKKKQASFHRNPHEQQPSKKAASRFNFWDWLTPR